MKIRNNNLEKFSADIFYSMDFATITRPRTVGEKDLPTMLSKTRKPQARVALFSPKNDPVNKIILMSGAIINKTLKKHTRFDLNSNGWQKTASGTEQLKDLP